MAIGLLPDKTTEVKTDPDDSEKEVNPGQNPPAVLRHRAAVSATGKPKKEKSGFPHNQEGCLRATLTPPELSLWA